jgi:hypothetical protein
VQEDFNRRRSLAAIFAVCPSGAPEVDPRTHCLKKLPPPVQLGVPPVLQVWDAMASGPSIALAPAPGPNSGKAHFDGHSQVKDCIQTSSTSRFWPRRWGIVHSRDTLINC